jgi:hypothetical protein
MMDYKSMPTPMMMNLKKMNEASSDSDEIDPHLYQQLIGSLMYLVNTRPDICRCRLGKERSGLKEHIWLLFYLRAFHGFLVQQETELCSLECGILQSSVASQAYDRFI